MNTIHREMPAVADAASIDGTQLLALLGCSAATLRLDPGLDGARFTLRRVQRGESVYRAGDTFESLYIVRSGFFKTVMFDPYGCEQVLGFPIQSDLLGVDGLAEGTYAAEPIALEASEVAIVPFGRLQGLAHHSPVLEQALYRTISRELVRDQGIQWILGTLGAEARVAAFLLNLAERFGRLGYSRSAFNLRMTRAELGSYLGLKLETVSRALSAFDNAGLVRVQQKAIEIRDVEALEALLDTAADEPRKAARAALSTRDRSNAPVVTHVNH